MGLGQDEPAKMKIDGIEASRPKQARVARQGYQATPHMLVWPSRCGPSAPGLVFPEKLA
jgi:hypothetical protein